MKLPLTLIGVALIASACANRPMGPAGVAGPAASATLSPKSGSSSMGTVAFSQKSDGVMVTVDLTGLKPNAEHGFHVHEKGECGGADAMGAGGHFNPMGKAHGAPMGEHHAGDIPNIRTDAAGRARGSFEIRGLTVGSGPADIVGRSVVIHRDADDYKSQPAGNSGPRIACGVINRV